MKIQGRPARIDRTRVIKSILEKKDLLVKNDKIVSKTNEVWNAIAKDLDNLIKPATLYKMVVCNENNLRDKITSSECIVPDAGSIHDVSVRNDSLESTNDTDGSFSNESSDEPVSEKFSFLVPKSEFAGLLTTKNYVRNEKSLGKAYSRSRTVLKPGRWQDWLVDKIWTHKRLKCGFNFKSNKFVKDGTSGVIRGRCKCGSALRCNVENEDENEYVTITCSITAGTKENCSKRYLRAPRREAIAKELLTKSAAIYRTERAAELMKPGDPEPPHLYKTSVLNTAKSEYQSKQYLHKNPVLALGIMKVTTHVNIIHSLGLDPFFVHYWSNHQIHVYRTYAAREPACICIDATGSLIKRVADCGGKPSQHIFLYAGVMLTADGNFPIMQMITESHRSTSIHAWLKEWIRSGAPRPREVITDSSRALLIAAIEAFTGFLTIEEYANACALEVPPHTYFRIDVAHFINNYAKILKDVPKRVRRFLLASVGQLIMATTVEKAAETLTSLLIISRSETTGELTTGNKSTCDVHFDRLKAQLDPRLDEFLAEESTEDIVEENGVNEDSADTNVESQNWWVAWGRNIDQRAKTIASNEEGNRENAFYLPKFADRLVKDVSLLPLWSSVCRNKFGYGRIPASSAAVESEFNIIKTHLQKNISALVRPDAFVEKHVNYLSGKIKIVHANVNNGKDVDADHKLHLMRSNTEEIKKSDEPSDVEEFFIAEVDRIEHVNTEKDSEPEIEHSESEIKHPEPEIEYPEPEIVAANELENWRGLATPKKTSRKSKYLHRNNETFDSISRDNLTKIPIIKNGNNMTLQAVMDDGTRISTLNTCAFDTILQIFLAFKFDAPKDGESYDLSQDTNSGFFKLVEQIITSGITAQSYRIRGKLLRRLFNPDCQLSDANVVVNCEANAGHLATLLFQNEPTITETTTCSAGCPPRIKKMVALGVPSTLLTDREEFEFFIDKHIKLGKPRSCCRKDCSGMERTVISSTGNFALLEVFPFPEVQTPIPLNDVPTCLADPLSAKKYKLKGLADFKPPPKSTRSSGPPPMGHYTAICLRPGNRWTKFNDLSEKTQSVSKTSKVMPHLLIFFKE